MKKHIHGAVDPRMVLKAIGARATPGRVALIELLEAEEHPLSINEIMRLLVAHKKVNIDHATAFRSLEALTTAGLLQKSDLGHGHAHYEWVSGRAHHHHIVCTKCGLVEEVELCDMDSLQSRVLKQSAHFAHLQSHTLEFFGECKKCARHSSSK